jgi:hypothetical protein
VLCLRTGLQRPSATRARLPRRSRGLQFYACGRRKGPHAHAGAPKLLRAARFHGVARLGMKTLAYSRGRQRFGSWGGAESQAAPPAPARRSSCLGQAGPRIAQCSPISPGVYLAAGAPGGSQAAAAPLTVARRSFAGPPAAPVFWKMTRRRGVPRSGRTDDNGGKAGS